MQARTQPRAHACSCACLRACLHACVRACAADSPDLTQAGALTQGGWRCAGARTGSCCRRLTARAVCTERCVGRCGCSQHCLLIAAWCARAIALQRRRRALHFLQLGCGAGHSHAPSVKVRSVCTALGKRCTTWHGIALSACTGGRATAAHLAAVAEAIGRAPRRRRA
jgi:hypothetical protein